MTMSTPSRPNSFSIAASVIPWLLDLATRLLARVLNMPEPLVHNTGVFVFVHVQAVETSIGNRSSGPGAGRRPDSSSAHPHETCHDPAVHASAPCHEAAVR
jgi:hypothetical protein